MPRLSVNVNKVATLRNARGGDVPDLVRAVETIVAAGAPGITVHPRADERHIRPGDVRAIAATLAPLRHQVEYNIEGDPRPDLLALVHEVKPHQCTLVPVRPGEITSEAGWSLDTPADELRAQVAGLRDAGVRVSLFVDPSEQAIDWAAGIGADRVELYTEPYARACEQDETAAEACFERYVAAAKHADSLGLGVNAGHDLDLDNLVRFRNLPGLREVSIGHALVADALYRGLAAVVRDYLDLLNHA